jgi:hypothetical protein
MAPRICFFLGLRRMRDYRGATADISSVLHTWDIYHCGNLLDLYDFDEANYQKLCQCPKSRREGG